MSILKSVVALLLFTGISAAWSAEKNTPPPPAEAPKAQTGTISGTVHPVSNDNLAKGATVEMHVAPAGGGKGEATMYNLYAEGSVAKKLKDLAKKGATATVTGVVNEKGYQVTSIQDK